jgi:hypothetical protein
MGKPWFKFYPTNWQADPGLRACSLAARGLWMDLICIMHDAKPYGHLLINGKRPSYYRISQIVGADVRVVKNLMAQLEKNGVFTCDVTGDLTSRRMVRNTAKSQTAQELNKWRWGNSTDPLDTRKKERGPAKESKGRKTRQAEQAWQRDLLHERGPDGFAKAIDILAVNPALVERATKAELRKPGSGVMAAVIGLSKLMGQPTA